MKTTLKTTPVEHVCHEFTVQEIRELTGDYPAPPTNALFKQMSEATQTLCAEHGLVYPVLTVWLVEHVHQGKSHVLENTMLCGTAQQLGKTVEEANFTDVKGMLEPAEALIVWRAWCHKVDPGPGLLHTFLGCYGWNGLNNPQTFNLMDLVRGYVEENKKAEQQLANDLSLNKRRT